MTIGPNGIDRARALAKRRAAWVAHAYAGLPYPTGQRRPIKDRKAVVPNPRRLSNPNPPSKHVQVLGHAAGKEVRYHFTKGYRVVIP